VKPAQSTKDGQRDTMHITEHICIFGHITKGNMQCNTIHSKTFQLHKRNNRLSNQMTNLLIITLAFSLIPMTLFDIISLGVDAVLCHDQTTCKIVHTCARSKMAQYNTVNNV